MFKERFKIYVTFSNDGGKMIEEHDQDTIASALTRLTRGPAASIGLIESVKVVDGLDCTNFLWEKGVLKFPRPDHI